MARYFFDILNNGTRVLDETGLELDDLKAAIGEAARALADMTEEMIEGSLRQELRIEIRSTVGEAILSVLLALEFSGLHALGTGKQ
ncbi:hypothetical protein MesoLjLc_45830 [Mesorhizobium sp. L-8-10]|uniref:DUF6894 family protein n=1 Tax=Mesorhizobium sp. L-8-10 TaxID=2744523 RepID=UPI0019252A3A|nr:hypothetical protein [Mesorhizobium sp. L-8-10]BCH32653.1 hypothetical protein MesoLjLc_45830 [Mesorhizobium sp. L-8-10]